MTRHYAVIGKQVAGSPSPQIHTDFAQQFNLPVEYGLLPCPREEDFNATVEQFFADGGCGLNVTTPFKLLALQYASEQSSGAKRAGASNTLKKEANGSVSACNTDGPGLMRDFKERLQIDLAGQRVLVLGAGGASAGIIYPLLEQQPQLLCVANRTASKAVDLVAKFTDATTNCELVATNLEQLQDFAPFDIIINATSAGLLGQPLDINTEVFANTKVAYDLSYGQAADTFLSLAKQAGVGKLADGLGMLVEQAAFSFAYWEGEMPSTATVYNQLAVNAWQG